MSEAVTLKCKRTVVSTKPVPPGKHYPLSVLSRLMEKSHVRIVLYYTALPGGDVTARLKESLSETLTEFPAVTGRLKRDDEGRWTVKCNDAGVRVVEARARGSVKDWLASVDSDKELMLAHWEDVYHKPYFWATFYIQLTEFECGGFTIGLSCSHLLADPICATTFLNAWAHKTLNRTTIASTFDPLPQRATSIDDDLNTPLIRHYKSTIKKSLSIPVANTTHTTISLAFSDQTVRACIAKAEITTGDTNDTAFQALAGLFWVCVTRAKGVIEGLLDLSVCVDARSALGVDERFFGSCVVYNGSRVPLDDSFSEAAKSVGRAVTEIDKEGVSGLVTWLERNEDGSVPLMNGCGLVCASLGHVEPYSAALGDGVKPIRASYYLEPVLELGQLGQVLILPGLPEQGPLSRVVMVTLPRPELAKLCDDELLSSFSPTLLMGLNEK